MAKLKLISISVVSLLLISLIISTFIFREKYQEQRAISAAQSVVLSGLNMQIQKTKEAQQAALIAERDKSNESHDSIKRIEELERLLKENKCSNIVIPSSVNNRMRDRAASFYSSADTN